MEIEKLQMCRICSVENVRMNVVANKNLQKLYEKLTDIPFVTEDSRPMLACSFCYTKLKQCCQLQRKCLEADKLFTQMLNGDDKTKPLITQGLLECFSRYIISPTVHVNCIFDDCQSGIEDIKEEVPDDCEGQDDIRDIKEEELTGYSNSVIQEELQVELEYLDSCPDQEDISPKQPASDSEDDVPLVKFTTEVEEESDLSKQKRRASEMQSASGAKKPKQEDTITTRQKKSKRIDSTIIRNTQKRMSTPDTNIKKPYRCDICQRSFHNLSNFKRHNLTHTGEKPYKCDTCQRSFLSSSNLKRHKIIHTGKKPYKCDICQRSFRNSGYLKIHKIIHTGEKPYKCEICLRSFTQRHNLINHSRTHTVEKPYK